jgi:type I restriction enzyme S subunit
LKETRLPLPPLHEQRRIVAKLDSLFARSRAARQELEHIPQLIRRCKQAVLEAAFRGDLTANWRQLRGDKKNFIPQTSKVLPREFDVIFIPEDWNFYSVEELTENHDGKRIPVKSSDRAIRQGNYPYYGASGAIDTIDDYIFDGEYLLIGEDGANLIARSTPIAFQVTGKFWVNNHAHVVKVRKNILIGFLSYYINSINLEPYVSGSAQPKLTQRNLNSIIVPLPSIEEQQEIVNRIEKLFKSVEVIEQNYQKAVKLLERLEQAILAKAFRGELVPQDPKDEPASVLLERIQAQRQEKPKRQSRRLKK